MEGHERILHIPANFPLSDVEIKVVLDRAGAAKLANEQMLRALADTAGLQYLALRPFNVYGPRMDTAGAYT